MQKTSFAQMRCSLARSLEVVGDWWSPLILRDLFLGVCRFDDLVEDLGISRNLLTVRLRALVDDGIVEKRSYAQRPARFEYVLSPAGLDLVPAILALTAWGDRWARPAEGKPLLFRHRQCGQIFNATPTCDCCGLPIKAEDVEVLPGPGGAAAEGTRVIARRLAGH